jgi:hypothetical protein
MSRSIPSGVLFRGQVDFYTSFSVRAVGVVSTDLTSNLFFNNSLLFWPLMNGTSVQDSSISSGNIYFHEIVGSPGFYSVRLFPNAIGFWRLVLNSSTLLEEDVLEFDVFPAAANSPGLIASFNK